MMDYNSDSEDFTHFTLQTTAEAYVDDSAELSGWLTALWHRNLGIIPCRLAELCLYPSPSTLPQTPHVL